MQGIQQMQVRFLSTPLHPVQSSILLDSRLLLTALEEQLIPSPL